MIKIIVPNYIYRADALHVDKAIAYDKQILKIASLEELKKEFIDAEVTILDKNSLLMAGLINAHTHIEFSANRTTLKYGDFMPWLYSVIENREELVGDCKTSCMNRAIDMMLESGITTFGAISSHGLDLEVCANAKQNVIFYNELIGSQATMADALFGDFNSRLKNSKSIIREGFYPAVAIHSPYSVHPILIKKAVQIVKDENLKLSTHFMESDAEREWLDDSKGDFKEFFETLLKQKNRVMDSKEFLELLDGVDTTLTHVVKANDDELHTIATSNKTVIHCPISNRLLGSGALDLDRLRDKKIDWILATDGLSSNYDLNLFEEMKIALFMHSDTPLQEFAKELIKSVTINASKALNLNKGDIAPSLDADMIVLDLDSEPTEDIALNMILQKYNVSKIIIGGHFTS